MLRRASTAFVLALALTAFQASPALAAYILEYGDSLTITVKDQTQFGFQGAIRPDGIITIPNIGEVEVTGQTPMQVQEKVRVLLARHLRSPEVTVQVSAYRPRSVMMLGQVTHQGLQDLTRANQTLVETIAMSGGFTPRSNATKVLVLRGNGARMRRFEVDVEKMMKTGDFSNNIVLEPGDRVQVPEVWWPDMQPIVSQVSLVVSLVTAVALVLNVYDRATGNR